MPRAACNPWVAMDVTTDPVLRSRLLRRVHEREVAGHSASSSDVRELVRNSWRRSVAAGVTPDQGAAPMRLTPGEVGDARERSPAERGSFMSFARGSATSLHSSTSSASPNCTQ